MDFARKQLLKYGWEEGKGLGKNENGIAKPVKATLKFDTAGFGCSQSEQFTNQWWDNVYNNASKNLKVKNENGKVKVKLTSGESIEISTKKKRNKVKGTMYGVFLKTSELTEKGIVDLPKDTRMESDNSDEKDTKKVNSGINSLTDEELYKACGGRTAHKGARHGLKLSGKLARLEEQEKLMLGEKNIQGDNNNDVFDVDYKQLRRIKRYEDICETSKSDKSLKTTAKKITKPKITKSDLSELSEKKQKCNEKMCNEETENCEIDLKFESLSLSGSQISNEPELENEIDLSKKSFNKIRRKKAESSKQSEKPVQPNSVAAHAEKIHNERLMNEESILVYRSKRKREEDDGDNENQDIKRHWSVFDVEMYKIQKSTLKRKVENLKNKSQELFKKVDKYDVLSVIRKEEDDRVLKKIEKRQKKYKTRYEDVIRELYACENELKITRRGLKLTKARLKDQSKMEDVLETISNLSVTDDSNQS